MQDLAFLLDALDIVCAKVEAKELHVRVQASWSLGNLCDSLREREEVLSPLVYAQLMEACLSATKDHDRVRVHGVRALGHLLYTLKEDQLGEIPTNACRVTDCDLALLVLGMIQCPTG